jgi:hypothetical protein
MINWKILEVQNMNNDKPLSATFNISPTYIEEEVSKLIKAAIVNALGDKDKLIRSAIDATIDTYVDEKGEECRKDSYRARPYLDYVAQKTVEKTVREVMIEVVNENRDEFKAEIRRQLGKRKWKESTAEAFVKLILDNANSQWKMPINISFQELKDSDY